jgi:hypothetical protein
MNRPTFKIIPFSSFRESEDFDDMLAGFEDLGISPKTYPLSQILEIWQTLPWEEIVDLTPGRLGNQSQMIGVEYLPRDSELKLVFQGKFEVYMDLDVLGVVWQDALANLEPSVGNPRFEESQIMEKLFRMKSVLQDKIQDNVDRAQREESPNWWVEIDLRKYPNVQNDEEAAHMHLDFEINMNVDEEEFSALMNTPKMIDWFKNLIIN